MVTSECVKKRLVPSANIMRSKTGNVFFRSLTYNKNRSGPRTALYDSPISLKNVQFCKFHELECNAFGSKGNCVSMHSS